MAAKLFKRIRVWEGLIRLNHLQQRLQQIYEIDALYNVEDFVVHDQQLASALSTSASTGDTPETLLLRQQDDALELSLFLDRWLLEHLAGDDPLQQLHPQNLPAFCAVLEGISHFIYLVWNARHARTISRFELELQAEVDKYIVAAALLAEQSGGRIPANLHYCLFEKIRYLPQPGHSDYQRYYLANHYARRYCYNLHRHLLDTPDCVALTREIRRFYRLLHSQKVSRINKLPVPH